MKIIIVITLAVTAAAQDMQRREVRLPDGRLLGRITCSLNRCEARDAHFKLVGTYSSLTRETRDDRGRLMSKGNTLDGLLWQRVKPLK